MEKYEKIRKIGKGYFGDVVLVERIHDHKQFALKQVDSLSFTNNNSSEAKLLESLNHPNIIKCYESFYDKQNLCIILEYADSGDLLKKIQEAKQAKDHLPESLIMEWFAQLCLAIKYLNDKKILHRDIKVHNTFLTKSGLIKLGDFGISKQLNNTSDFANTQVGTPFYLSPEMCLNSTHKHKSDIWMLGCLLHELCSLSKPFPGDALHVLVHKITKEKPTEIPNHYSPFIKRLITQLLEKDPNDRPNINQILKYDEIIKEVNNLRVKYAEAYKDFTWDFLSKPSSIATTPIYNSIGITSNMSSLGKENEIKREKGMMIDQTQDDKKKRTNGTQSDKLGKDGKTIHSSMSSIENIKPPLQIDRDAIMHGSKRRNISHNSISSLIQLQKARLSVSPSSTDRDKSMNINTNGSSNNNIPENILCQQNINNNGVIMIRTEVNERFTTDSSIDSPQPLSAGKIMKSQENNDSLSPLIFVKSKSMLISNYSYKSDIIEETINDSSGFDDPPLLDNIIVDNGTIINTITNANAYNITNTDTNDNNTNNNDGIYIFSTKNLNEAKPYYHRDIKINTEGLERVYSHRNMTNIIIHKEEKEKANNYNNQSYKSPLSTNSSDQTPNSCTSSQNEKNSSSSSLPTSKITKQKKSFAFSEKLFDNSSPATQNRYFWFCQFLIKKLGEEKFEKIKAYIENNSNSMQTNDDQNGPLLEIIGEENRDCLKMIKCLISGAVTPTSDNKTTKDIDSSASSKKSSNCEKDDIPEGNIFLSEKSTKSQLSSNTSQTILKSTSNAISDYSPELNQNLGCSLLNEPTKANSNKIGGNFPRKTTPERIPISKDTNASTISSIIDQKYTEVDIERNHNLQKQFNYVNIIPSKSQ